MTRPPLFLAMEPVIEALKALSVPYYVGGSVASSAVGTARTTLDADLVADLKPKQVPVFVATLGDRYYANQEAILDAVARKSCFNVIHLATMFKVDVFAVKDRSYDRVAFERSRPREFSIGSHVGNFIVASPEDIVLNKLEWFRLGDEISQRQWHDVLGVLRVQRDRLDMSYLEEWAKALSIDGLFARAKAEAWANQG